MQQGNLKKQDGKSLFHLSQSNVVSVVSDHKPNSTSKFLKTLCKSNGNCVMCVVMRV